MVWDKGPMLVFLVRRISSFPNIFGWRMLFPVSGLGSKIENPSLCMGRPSSSSGLHPAGLCVCHPARPHTSGACSFLVRSSNSILFRDYFVSLDSFEVPHEFKCGAFISIKCHRDPGSSYGHWWYWQCAAFQRVQGMPGASHSHLLWFLSAVL